MSLLLFLARVFIDTFGITHPTPQQERRAAFFIGGLLFLIIAIIVVATIAFMQATHH